VHATNLRGAGDERARGLAGGEDQLQVIEQALLEGAREVAAAGQAGDVRVRVVSAGWEPAVGLSGTVVLLEVPPVPGVAPGAMIARAKMSYRLMPCTS
jgi:hypothetical protein